MVVWDRLQPFLFGRVWEKLGVQYTSETRTPNRSQQYAEEVYFKSLLNQDMSYNMTFSKVSYDFSKEIITFKH